MEYKIIITNSLNEIKLGQYQEFEKLNIELKEEGNLRSSWNESYRC